MAILMCFFFPFRYHFWLLKTYKITFNFISFNFFFWRNFAREKKPLAKTKILFLFLRQPGAGSRGNGWRCNREFGPIGGEREGEPKRFQRSV